MTDINKFADIMHKQGIDLLNEVNPPSRYVSGWCFYCVTIEGIFVIDKLYARPSKGATEAITKKLYDIANENGLKITISEAVTKMMNPDRCMYNAKIK